MLGKKGTGDLRERERDWKVRMCPLAGHSGTFRGSDIWKETQGKEGTTQK